MEMTWEDDNTRHVKADTITVLFPGSFILWGCLERMRRDPGDCSRDGKIRDSGNEVDAITALTVAMLESNERWTYHD